jgi:tetratricopeptide (TPR) repeat protein
MIQRHSIKEYSIAIELNPEDAHVVYNRGVSYANLENLEKAIQDFTRSLQLDPTDSDVFISRGRLLKATGKIEEARADFRAAKCLQAS